MFIRSEHLSSVFLFIDGTLGHEDGIVVALSEDKCSQYHIDDIELYVEQPHQSEYPHPADGHWQEREHRQLQTAEREPQEEEHDAAASPSDIVEII